MWQSGRTDSFNEGSGIQKLLGFRAKWYSEKIRPLLEQKIDAGLEDLAGYEGEFYSRAYNFLRKFINPETGAIHFYDTPSSEGVILAPFKQGNDTSHVWKTQDLYYIKKQKVPIGMSAPVGETGQNIHFEIGDITTHITKGDDLIYGYDRAVEDGIVITVEATTQERKTKVGVIAKAARKDDYDIPISEIEKAIRDFQSQPQVDFFINKDAEKFLLQMLDHESGQRLVSQIRHADEMTNRRENFYRDVMESLIALCAQFEDELQRIWLKKKFVHHSNYVITLDKIADSIDLLNEIVKHEGMGFQVEMWKQLGIVEEKFHFADIVVEEMNECKLDDEYQFLPIDTRFFRDILYKILDEAFDSIDEELDGWLIHADNFQALNNIKEKFANQIQTGYIDPPWSAASGANFQYLANFEDSTWLTMMENRLQLVRELMSENGAFFLHLDHRANHLGKSLLCDLFGKEGHRNDIIWRYGKPANATHELQNNHDVIYYWAMSQGTPHHGPVLPYYNPIRQHSREMKEGKLVNKKDSDGKLVYEERTETKVDNVWGVHGKDRDRKLLLSYLKEGTAERRGFTQNTPLISYLDDVVAVMPASPENLGFYTQKPETLVARTFEMTSEENDLVIDFFLGSGTSVAAAHKMGRRWIGMEMGNNFHHIYVDKHGKYRKGILGRMAQVLAGTGKKVDEDSGTPTKTVSEPTKLSAKLSWEGGGAFKYYTMETYDDVLAIAKYASSSTFDIGDARTSYLFLSDPKMIEGVNPESGSMALENLFGEDAAFIDLAETLSHVTGLKIKSITETSVILLRGDEDWVVNYDEIPVDIWRQLLWWAVRE